ncbi:hypothetical protein NL676_019856 [Syzygium grande]|nr:hypothetical protein NL676_019856 [Syzygium grande]
MPTFPPDLRSSRYPIRTLRSAPIDLRSDGRCRRSTSPVDSTTLFAVVFVSLFTPLLVSHDDLRKEEKIRYAAGGGKGPGAQPRADGGAAVVRRPQGGRGLTLWTLCSYCYYAHEYGKAYEGCSLQCANCRQGFHAAAICSLLKVTAFSSGRGVERNGAVGGGGGGHYKCRLGLFRLRKKWGAREGRGKEEGLEEKIDVGDYLVKILSDDSAWGWRARPTRAA